MANGKVRILFYSVFTMLYSGLHTDWTFTLLPQVQIKGYYMVKSGLKANFCGEKHTLFSFHHVGNFELMVKNFANFYLTLAFKGLIGNGKKKGSIRLQSAV